jgi:acyl-CoA dehydrogenase
MSDRSFLQWPFFDEVTGTWPIASMRGPGLHSPISTIPNVDATCKALVKALGDAGWLKLSAVDPADETSKLDVRSLCILRETLARHDGLADFAFAMQGLGTGAFRCSARRTRNRNG